MQKLAQDLAAATAPAGGAGFGRGAAGAAPAAPTIPDTIPTDPAAIKGLMVIPFNFWDETVVPGRTYKYQVVVEFANPLFKWGFGTAKAGIAQQDRLASMSVPVTMDKADKIKILSDTEFFVVNGSANTSAEVEVYKQTGGQWYKATSGTSIPMGGTVAPSIRMPGGGGLVPIDTGYTLVDVVGKVGNEVHVVLRDSDGNLITRDSATDSKSSVRLGLIGLVRAAVVAPPATESQPATPTPPPTTTRRGPTTRGIPTGR
jgi:hypothetical protein